MTFDATKLSTQDEKLRSELIERLHATESPDILQRVREILYNDEPPRDFWDDLSARQQAMVRKGMAELREGKGIPAAQVLRNLRE